MIINPPGTTFNNEGLMNTYTLLIILCGLVIFSYLFDLIARQTRFPSVLLLLLTGIGIRLVIDYLRVNLS